MKIVYTYAIWTKHKSMQICTQNISDHLNLSKTLTVKKALQWTHTDSLIAVWKAHVETDGSVVRKWPNFTSCFHKYAALLWNDPGDQYLCTNGNISTLLCLWQLNEYEIVRNSDIETYCTGDKLMCPKIFVLLTWEILLSSKHIERKC